MHHHRRLVVDANDAFDRVRIRSEGCEEDSSFIRQTSTKSTASSPRQRGITSLFPSTKIPVTGSRQKQLSRRIFGVRTPCHHCALSYLFIWRCWFEQKEKKVDADYVL